MHLIPWQQIKHQKYPSTRTSAGNASVDQLILPGVTGVDSQFLLAGLPEIIAVPPYQFVSEFSYPAIIAACNPIKEKIDHFEFCATYKCLFNHQLPSILFDIPPCDKK